MEDPPFPAAAVEAVRDAAKTQLRIAGDFDDAALAAMAATALALAEAFTGRTLIARSFSTTLMPDGKWQLLTAAPVQAITAVERVLEDGEEALEAAAYAIDIDADGAGWVRSNARGPIRVEFTAGLAVDWAGLPAPLAYGVLLLVAHLFNDRDGVAAPPAAVSALWRPWRSFRIAGRERRA